ncbi:MAG: LytR family transcriptional regulator [Streptosporangiales bacterium]|nr:LytR family transcriptional regulator [Streptosporangiales bacterium]
MSDRGEPDPYERYFRPRGPARDSGRSSRPERPARTASPSAGAGRRDPTPSPSPGPRLPSAAARRRRAMLMTAGVMSAVVLVASGGAWAFSGWVSGRIEKIGGLGGGHSGPEGALNILLVGADRREGMSREQQNRLHLGRTEGQRSDTMMLVHINRQHDRVSVVSLPRDSWVTVPGHGQRKINSAYTLGGPKLAMETVQHNTGLRLDHYVEVNFLGFLKVVDALGGVEVCVPRPIQDVASGLNLQAGKQLLGGEQALAYVRARHVYSNQDLGRIDAQQRFMASMLSRATSTSTLSNPVKTTRFLDAALSSVRTDEGLSAATMRQLANELRGVSPDDLSFSTVPIANSNYRTPTGESAVLWNRQASSALFGKLRRDEPLIQPPATPTPGKKPGGRASATPGPARAEIPPNRIAVRVYNAAGVQGLGARVAADLRRVGFIVPQEASNAGQTGVAGTVIRYGPAREDSARTLAAAVPGVTLQPVPALGNQLQLVAGSGYSGVRSVAVDGSSGSSGASDGGGGGGATPTPGIEARTARENACPS